jgi:hypothetical protein
MADAGDIEAKGDIEKGSDGVVKRWLTELEQADKTESNWRKAGNEALSTYRLEEHNNDDLAKRKETFNILWANTETIRPVLYNSLPRPDIRRRYRDKDPLGKAISEVCERASTYSLDAQQADDIDFDAIMIAAVNDMLLPGRAITRVRYIPSFVQTEAVEGAEPVEGEEPAEEVAFEEVKYEQVQWDDFRRGPGKSWNLVPWIAFRHKLTKEQVQKEFPEFVDLVKYDATVKDDKTEQDRDDPDKEVFKRCLVWEIWDKDEKKVKFISPSYKDKALKIEDDPLQLQGFWCIPRPLYAIESSTTLIPSTKYSMYETLAKELENVTNRIRKIIDGLRLRGVYDARIPEIEKLFDSFDNAFVPSENITALMELGGLDKAIFTLPMEMYAEVLVRLYEYRQGLIQQIYEITGISDVIRGDTNPNETLGAQQIKANFGSQRLQREQREVQRYARDLVRITVEIVAEHFSVDTLRLMTGLKFPTDQEKQQAQQMQTVQMQQAQMQYQQMAQQAQMAGQQPPPPPPPPQPDPQLIKMMQTPSWEDIQKGMSNDMMRDFRIDIETESTIQAQQQQDQKNITELLSGITNFFASVAEPIQSGALTVEAAKSMIMAAVRRFKLGREVEDALEDIEAPKGPQGVPQEQVDEQMKQVQQQAEQQVQKTTQEMQGKAQEAEQRGKQMVDDAIGKAKEAEMKAMEMAKQAEAQMTAQTQAIQKQSTEAMTAEKARNAITEKGAALDYKQKVFDLTQQLKDVEDNYQEELFGLKQDVVDMQNAYKSECQTLKAAATKPAHMSGMNDKHMANREHEKKEKDESDSALKILTESLSRESQVRESNTAKMLEALSKPRKVVRSDDGTIEGIE